MIGGDPLLSRGPYNNPNWSRIAGDYFEKVLPQLTPAQREQLYATVVPRIDRNVRFPMTNDKAFMKVGISPVGDPQGVLAARLAVSMPGGVTKALELADKSGKLEDLFYSAMRLEDQGVSITDENILGDDITKILKDHGVPFPQGDVTWDRQGHPEPLLALFDAVGKSAPKCDREYVQCGYAYGRTVQATVAAMRRLAYEYPTDVTGPRELYLAGTDFVGSIFQRLAAMMGGRDGKNAPHLVYYLSKKDQHSLESLNEAMFYILARPDTLKDNVEFLLKQQNDAASPAEVLPLVAPGGDLFNFMKGLTCGYGVGPMPDGRRFDCIARGYPAESPTVTRLYSDGTREQITILGSDSKESRLSPNALFLGQTISALGAGGEFVGARLRQLSSGAKADYLPLTVAKEIVRYRWLKIVLEKAKFDRLGTKVGDQAKAVLAETITAVLLDEVLPKEAELRDSQVMDAITGKDLRDPESAGWYRTFKDNLTSTAQKREGRKGPSSSTPPAELGIWDRIMEGFHERLSK
jgi:hypothetical protein